MEEAENNMLNMEIDFGDNNNAKNDNNDKEEENNEINSNILYSNAPVEEWQREVEKMSSKLKPENLNLNYAAGEWRGHIDQIKTYNTVEYVNNEGFHKIDPGHKEYFGKIVRGIRQKP
jgi:hypothetical protein